jgi:hypothetical protein
MRNNQMARPNPNPQDNVDERSSRGVNCFAAGDKVIVVDDPFGKYMVMEITRAGRVRVIKENGLIRSLTATACSHPYDRMEKK